MSTAHVLLIVTGTLCEAVGLTWIVVEASRARAAEFGERGLFRRIYDWFAYWLGPPTHAVGASLHGTATGRASVSGTLTVPRQESDIERISRELPELRARVERGGRRQPSGSPRSASGSLPSSPRCKNA